MKEYEFPITRADAKKEGLEFSSEKNKNAPFPTRLRELRKDKGFSQQQCADLLGVSKSAIGYWETGDTLPDAKSMALMAETYNVSADYLLGLTDVKTPDMTVKQICELTGLSESAVDMLIWIKEREANPEFSPVEGRSLNERRMLDTLNLLIQYQPYVLANIADYLFFRFAHFASGNDFDTVTPISDEFFYAVGDYGDQHEHVIPLSGRDIADMKLLQIQSELRQLRKDIERGELSDVAADFF